MSACREVKQWMTKTIISPVSKAITESKKVCENIDEWVEEQIQQPVENWITKQVEECEDLPWYDPRGWFCWLVDIVVKVIEWVVITIGKWVAKLVCKVVTHIVGFVIEMVTRVISWVVTFATCIFSEPIIALTSFGDLWQIFTDAVDRVFEFADALLGFVQDALVDLKEFVDSLAASLGWLGIILGFFSGIIGLAANFVGAVRDVAKGAKDVIGGILWLSPCRMLRGASNFGIGVVQAGVSSGFVFGAPIRAVGAAIGGGRDAFEAEKLERMIRERIAGMNWTDARKKAAIAACRFGRATAGLSFTLDVRRLFVSSENPRFNARMLHQAGTINLYRLAGYLADCDDGFESPDGEVVYEGTQLRVSVVDLQIYLEDGPGSTAPFEVFGFTEALARSHAEITKRKARALGIRPRYELDKIEAALPDHVPFLAFESAAPVDQVQQALFAAGFGRTADGANLSSIPSVAVLRYAVKPDIKELNGLTVSFRPPGTLARSGITWRGRTPDIFFRWVYAHECGHYWGLDHNARDGGARPLRDLMYKPSTGEFAPVGDLAEYLLLGGEPRFPFDDARTVWDWLTGDAVAAVIFPA